MKKIQFDLLQKARQAVVDFAENAQSVSALAQNVVDEIESHVTQLSQSLVSMIDERLEESPLEDPIIPTAKSAASDVWSKVTDSIGVNTNLTRDQKIDYILKYGKNEAFARWRDPLFVMEQSDDAVDNTYLGVVLGEKIVKKAFGEGFFDKWQGNL